MNLVNEIKLLFSSFGSVKFGKITKEKLLFELISNGIAALVAVFVYHFIQSFFVVDSNLKYGIRKTFAPHKMKATEISKSDFEWIMDWIGNPIIFIISIFVFSFIEQVMQNYLEERKRL